MLLPIRHENPEPHKIRRAVRVLSEGGILAYPTDTVYGLCCDAFNRKGADRIYAMKGMDHAQPLTLVCSSLSELSRYGFVENHGYRVLRRHVPGPYCFILRSTREVPKSLESRRRTIGIRVPKHDVVYNLVESLGRPLLSTTAQTHAADPLIDPEEIERTFRDVDLVLDAGVGGSIPSTIIDLTTNPYTIVREGAGSVADFMLLP